MKKFKVFFYIQYWNNKYLIVEKIIFAENDKEVYRNGLKIFVNDVINDENTVLDHASIIRFNLKKIKQID